MCFNSNASLLTFSIGCFFSFLLIHSKNKKYVLENKITGVFFIFISFIQFMDFIFWNDIDNKIGLNKIATILGPFLNVLQPVILYLIKIYYYRPTILTPYNLIFALINLLYFILYIKTYISFISSGLLVTSKENGHLKWPWLKYSYSYFYVILLAINIFYLFKIKYSILLFTINYIMLYISFKYFKYNIGELWCFFGAFIPLIIYFTTLII